MEVVVGWLIAYLVLQVCSCFVVVRTDVVYWPRSAVMHRSPDSSSFVDSTLDIVGSSCAVDTAWLTLRQKQTS